MIDGVQLHPLKQIKDERGKVMHMLRSDAPYFKKFGEVYFSQSLPGQVKAWKKHLRMTQNLTVPSGRVRFVIFDSREDSPTFERIQELELGQDNYQLLIIPPGIWYGFKAVSTDPALIANCADIPHDPSEVDRLNLDQDTIPYTWD